MKAVSRRWSVLSKGGGLSLRAVRFALCLLGAVLIAPCITAHAQQSEKIWRIGYLDPSTAETTGALLQAFHQEMSKLGWSEGKNYITEHRYGELKSERMPQLAAELIEWKADVILAAGGGPGAARKVTATIPIVVATGIDLVQAGLAKSLAKPGGNVTGLSILGPELITKRLEILKEVVPKLSRVGVLMRAGPVQAPGNSSKWTRSELRRTR